MAKKAAVSREQQIVTWSELNQLRALGVLPEAFEKATIDTGNGTPVYDINGDVLFHRIPLARGRSAAGYVDMAPVRCWVSRWWRRRLARHGTPTRW